MAFDCGGKEVPGRYIGKLTKEVSAESLYGQIKEYRRRYPEKALVQHQAIELEKAWAFLMGGGSLLIGRMQYADSRPPKQPWWARKPSSWIATSGGW